MHLSNNDSLGRQGEVLASIAWPGGVRAWAQITRTSIDGVPKYVLRAATPNLVEPEIELTYDYREDAERDWAVLLYGICWLSLNAPRSKYDRTAFAAFLDGQMRQSLEDARNLEKLGLTAGVALP